MPFQGGLSAAHYGCKAVRSITRCSHEVTRLTSAQGPNGQSSMGQRQGQPRKKHGLMRAMTSVLLTQGPLDRMCTGHRGSHDGVLETHTCRRTARRSGVTFSERARDNFAHPGVGSVRHLDPHSCDTVETPTDVITRLIIAQRPPEAQSSGAGRAARQSRSRAPS